MKNNECNSNYKILNAFKFLFQYNLEPDNRINISRIVKRKMAIDSLNVDTW